MLHIQMNSGQEHFKLVEYHVSLKDTKLIQSDKGVVMCLPEFAYFVNMIDRFTQEMRKKCSAVPCYTLRGHSKKYIECYPYLEKVVCKECVSHKNKGSIMSFPLRTPFKSS